MKNNRPEAWQAQCLRDYIEQLTAAVRMLEWQAGHHDGLAESQVAA
jgi:hypothetical protein